MLGINAFAQTTVTGTITDSTGKSLSGVSVKVKATRRGTMTDARGAFTLPAPKNAVLEVSYIGYQTQEIPVAGKSQLAIQLKESPSGLNEVVVVGYGKQKKMDLTGAVDQVGSEYLENRPVPNVSRALEGAIPNLNISYTDGRPTTNPGYNIRGLTSIGAGGSALILIDGVAGDPSTLNPLDIASVTVLKDAASASIYGSRGVFGVVLITTKNPGRTKSRFTYSGAYSLDQRTVTPHIVTDGYQWADLFNQSYSAWYNYTSIASTIGNSGIAFSTTYLDSLQYRSQHPGTLPVVSTDPATGNYTYYGNTNWDKLLYKKVIPTMQHTLSASGGNDRFNYLLSGMYYTQGGLYNIRADEYNKYNFRSKEEIRVTDWLKLTANTVYSSIDYTDPLNTPNSTNGGGGIEASLFGAGDGAPMAVMYNPDGTLTQAAANGVGALLGPGRSRTQYSFLGNNVGFVGTVLKNILNLEGDFSYQNTNTQTDTKSVPISYSTKPGLISQLGTSGLASAISKQYYYEYNLFASYKQSFGNHNLSAVAGTNLIIDKVNTLSLSRDNLLVPQLSDFDVAVGQNQLIGGGGNEWATVGEFARINYNYKEKYLLEVNGRYDGSSKFPQNKEYGFFPSVSAGWRISQENFMKGTQHWLDNLKIRASYGSLGNSQISPYVYLQQLIPSQSPVIINGTLPAFIAAPAAIPNKFTWETATTTDFGIDIDVLKTRLSTSFDWYERKTTNMITGGPTLPATFGTAVPSGNNADLNAKGFELSLMWKDQIATRKPISYSIRVTLADNVGHITKFYNPLGSIATNPYTFTQLNYYVGEKVGDIWGYATDRLFTSAADITSSPNQSAVQVSAANVALPGDIKFKDLNHDGKIDQGQNTLANHGDLKIIGNSTPRYSFGLTSNFNWNNFGLSAFFQGVAKMDWYPTYGSTSFWGQYTIWYGSVPESTLKNNWSLDGNKPDSYWPRYRGPMPYGQRELQPQTRYLQNAAYVRLKDLTISYNLPRNLIKNVKVIQDVQIYLSGQNIWMYTPMFKITHDIDPEVISSTESSGYQGDAYPMLKTYTFGINITL